MSTRYRLLCPACGKPINIDNYNWVCPSCHQQIMPYPGYIQVYRKGNYFGMAMPQGVFIDGIQCGVIGNKETLRVCVPYGHHTMRVGDSPDFVCDITPEFPFAYAKAYVQVGMWRGKWMIEPSVREEMPEGNEPHILPPGCAAPQPQVESQPANQIPVTPAPAQTPVSPASAPAQTPVSPAPAPAQTPISPASAPAQTPISPASAPAQTPISPASAPAQTQATAYSPQSPTSAYNSQSAAQADASQIHLFCTQCGTKLPEGSKFCPRCGHPIGM